MNTLLTLFLMSATPAAAQARNQLNFEVIIAQVPKNAPEWESLGRKLEPVSADAAEGMRRALAADETRVMARPLITAYEDQEARFEQRSGEEFVTASISGKRVDNDFTLDIEVHMDVLSNPATWTGTTEGTDSGGAMLGMRPKKNLVVLVRARPKT